MSAATNSPAAPTVAVNDLAKSYGAVQAVKGVSFSLAPGTITALVGDNGAGKSTVAKMVSGALRPTSGHLALDGERVEFKGPLEARASGIEAVYQDLAVAPDLDVATNLFLGRELVRRRAGRFIRLVDRPRMYAEAQRALDDLGVRLPSLRQPVGSMSGGQRQAVSVARGAMWARKLLILDEPTAALGVRETAMVVDLMKRIREKGLSMLLISHSLPEIFAVADRVVVLRGGRKVADVRVAESTMDEIVSFITGARVHVEGPEVAVR